MKTYELLLQCYRSGQISERQWQEHLKDEAFAAWIRNIEQRNGVARIGG
jgi:hypothetical protein